MINRYLILTYFFVTLFSCEERKISDVYNECYSKEVKVNGVSIKKYLQEFENELINSNLLKDSSGKSYKEFFYELMTYDYIVLENKYSFLDSIKSVNFRDIMKCPLEISFHTDFEKSIFGKLSHYMKENDGDHLGFFKSEPMESIFNEKTFEYDYIKHKLFNIIKVYDKSKYRSGAVLCKLDNCPSIN